jgi:hypothetical protein
LGSHDALYRLVHLRVILEDLSNFVREFNQHNAKILSRVETVFVRHFMNLPDK